MGLRALQKLATAQDATRIRTDPCSKGSRTSARDDGVRSQPSAVERFEAEALDVRVIARPTLLSFLPLRFLLCAAAVLASYAYQALGV